MTSLAQRPVIRRIVVTLDSSDLSRPALDIAVRLAAALGAELEGVFVEDINLIRLSELPFLREVRTCSLVEAVISAESMQRDLRALARRAERALQQAAQAMGVGCSFRVWRGSAAVETLSTSFEADIVGLCGIRPPTAYRAVPVLRPREPATPVAVNTVNVLFNASPRADKVLATACQLANTLGAQVRVLLPAGEPPESGLQQHASELLEAHDAPRAHFVRLGSDTAAALAAAIPGAANSVLIADVDHPLFRQAGLARCLAELGCPALLVR